MNVFIKHTHTYIYIYIYWTMSAIIIYRFFLCSIFDTFDVIVLLTEKTPVTDLFNVATLLIDSIQILTFQIYDIIPNNTQSWSLYMLTDNFVNDLLLRGEHSFASVILCYSYFCKFISGWIHFCMLSETIWKINKCETWLYSLWLVYGSHAVLVE